MTRFNAFGEAIPDPTDDAAKAKAEAEATALASKKAADATAEDTAREARIAAEVETRSGERARAIADETLKRAEQIARLSAAPAATAPANPYDVDAEPEKHGRWEIESGIAKMLGDFEARVGSVATAIAAKVDSVRALAAEPINRAIEADPSYKVVKTEFETELSKLSQESQNDPNIRKELLSLVKGRNFNTLVEAEVQRRTHHAEGANQIGNPVFNVTKKRYILDEDQLAAAKRYGFDDPQKYAADLEDMGIAVPIETAQ